MWGRDDETKNSGLEKSVWLFVRALIPRGRPEHTQWLLLHTAAT